MGDGMKPAAGLLIVSFVLFFFCSPDLLYAQRRGGSRSGAQQPWAAGGLQPRERSGPLVFDNKPFNIALGQLPPFYAGYEPGLLYGKLKSDDPEGRALLYAIRFISAERSYDAGAQVLRVHCPLSAVLNKGKEDGALRGFSVKREPLVDNRYTGVDASGEKVEIEEFKFREYVVAFPNFMDFPMEKPLPPGVREAGGKEITKDHRASDQDGDLPQDVIAASIPLSPVEAKQPGDRVQALLVFGPAPPWATYDSVQERSTSGKLRDLSAEYYYIHAHLLEIWLYEFQTGKVLAKLQPAKTAALSK